MKPKLRFKNFNNEWEEIELRNIASEIAYGMNSASKEYDGENKYIRITDIDENSNRYSNKDVVSPDGILEDRFLVKENDILFARTGASTGKTYLYNSNDGKLYYAGFLIKASIINHNSNFIFQQTKLNKYNNWIKIMSMRSGQPGINSQEYGSYRFSITNIDEENKVSNFLSLIDKKIELQSKKIEDLKLFKKGLISKLLNGYDYENMKIKDVLNFEQPTKYIVDSDEYINDDKAIPVLTANKAFILGYCNEKNYYDKGDSIIFDDFTMDMKYTNFNYKIKSSAIKILTAKENHDLKFLYELLLSLNLTSEEHKRHYISTVQEMNVKIPNIEIQKNISSKLNLIDNKILLEENFFNNLIKLKKGLMQNMFV